MRLAAIYLLLASAGLSGLNAPAAFAEGPTQIVDSKSGFSDARLAHLERFIESDIDKGLIRGGLSPRALPEPCMTVLS